MNLAEWLKEVKQHGNEDVRIYLIGNKSEVEEDREVSYQRALEFAKLNDISMVFETSAKTGQNVEDVFSIAGKEILLQIKKEEEIQQLEKDLQEKKRKEQVARKKRGQKLKSNKKDEDDEDDVIKKKKKTCC